jgi:hypothetical protein
VAEPAPLQADSKDDPASAARVIDRVPALDDRPAAALLLRLLVLRGDIAVRLGDEETAAAVLERAGAVPLTDGQRDTVHDALLRLEDLRGRGPV